MENRYAKPTAPFSASEEKSRGRLHQEPSPQYRSQFQRDRDRIIHSSAFRRLEYKTQVFVNHEGDLFRTRLTHSIEVAQIGRSVSRVLLLDEDLTEAISLAHDLGHTPFGHAGQDALNACMSAYGGFEHNLQSLRVVDELEEKYAQFKGLNLTFETREGILKHCSLVNARKLGAIGERFIEKKQASLEAQLANLADEIAYNNHDVDDGLRAKLIGIEELLEVRLFAEQYQVVKQQFADISSRRLIHEIVRRMINSQVTDLIETSVACLKASGVSSIEEVRDFGSPLMQFSAEMQAKNLDLKQFLRTHLYHHYRVHRMSAKAKKVITQLFEVFMDDPKLMPPDAQDTHRELSKIDADHGGARAIADYIAGMTDRFAILEYERVFNPSKLTLYSI